MRAPVCAVAGVMSLGGCLGDMTLPRLEFGPRPSASAQVIEVARGAIAIAGPRGYCIDRDGSRPNRDPAFVLLGACDAVPGGDEGVRPFRRAILTATVVALPEGTASPRPEVVAAFFGTEPGLRMLSRRGDPAQVEVLASIVSGDTLLLRIRDRGRPEGVAVAPSYWRAVFALDRHMVTLAVLAPAEAPISSASERVLLEQFIDRVRSVNDGEPEI